MKTCTWREDAEGNWHTDCGGCLILWDDTPSDNDMMYCCYCGKPLVEVEYTEPTMEDDA